MIRIAKGPPTDIGDYKCRHKQNRNRWSLCQVWDRGNEFLGEQLWVKIDGKLKPLKDMVKAGWQFSTRIPDPIEETDGE